MSYQTLVIGTIHAIDVQIMQSGTQFGQNINCVDFRECFQENLLYSIGILQKSTLDSGQRVNVFGRGREGMHLERIQLIKPSDGVHQSNEIDCCCPKFQMAKLCLCTNFTNGMCEPFEIIAS